MKNYILLYTLLFVVVYNNVLSQSTKIQKPEFGIIYQNNEFKLEGDKSIDANKISYAYIKFQPYISFSDFNVAKIESPKKVKLDLKSNKYGRYFRTQLRNAYSSDEPNFAGHYTFVKWGCGSPCKMSMIIDRRTGKIYDSPSATLGYEYRKNSRLLIVNPPESDGFYADCAYCKPEIYIFDEKTKKFLQRKANYK